MYTVYEELFRSPLRDMLEARIRQLEQRIGSMAVDGLRDELIERLESEACVQPIRLDRSRLQLPQAAKSVRIHLGRARALSMGIDGDGVDGREVEYSLPFEGDSWLFGAQPSQYPNKCPTGRVLRGRLHIAYQVVDRNPDAVRTKLKGDLDAIEQFIANQQKDIAEFHRRLPVRLKAAVDRRRKQSDADAYFIAGLGSV